MRIRGYVSLVGWVILSGGCGDNIKPATDGAPPDAPVGDVDAPAIDAMATDSAVPDAAIDASMMDAGDTDASTADASTTDASMTDASMTDAGGDASMLDAPLDAPGPDAPVLMGPHLLLTEVVLSNNSREFIEIYNPTGQAVDLTDYYLADHSDYALLPGAYGAGPPPVINDDLDPAMQFDFVVRFPGGSTIAPGQAVVIAMRYNDFTSTFGTAPDYALYDAPAASAMLDAGGGVFPGIGGNSNLSNGGEMVALFHWDGVSDRVRDVDLVNAGNSILIFNQVQPKTGVALDGPDPGTDTTQYADDLGTLGDIDGDAANGQSHKRIALEDGFELHSGVGNGITGHDETSETLAQTWDQSAGFTAPTPGQVPAALMP